MEEDDGYHDICDSSKLDRDIEMKGGSLMKTPFMGEDVDGGVERMTAPSTSPKKSKIGEGVDVLVLSNSDILDGDGRRTTHIEMGIVEEEDYDDEDNDDGKDESKSLVTPLVVKSSFIEGEMRSRKRTASPEASSPEVATRGNAQNLISMSGRKQFYNRRKERLRECCHRAAEIQKNLLRNTITLMNLMAKVLFWISLFALAGGVIWYSRELAVNG